MSKKLLSTPTTSHPVMSPLTLGDPEPPWGLSQRQGGKSSGSRGLSAWHGLGEALSSLPPTLAWASLSTPYPMAPALLGAEPSCWVFEPPSVINGCL